MAAHTYLCTTWTAFVALGAAYRRNHFVGLPGAAAPSPSECADWMVSGVVPALAALVSALLAVKDGVLAPWEELDAYARWVFLPTAVGTTGAVVALTAKRLGGAPVANARMLGLCWAGFLVWSCAHVGWLADVDGRARALPSGSARAVHLGAIVRLSTVAWLLAGTAAVRQAVALLCYADVGLRDVREFDRHVLHVFTPVAGDNVGDALVLHAMHAQRPHAG